MDINFIGKVKLSKQGQLTLPFEARKELDIEKDSDLYWYMVDDHLVIVKDLVNPKDLEIKLKKGKQ